MDSNVYVNNNDLVENYFVRIDEKKIRQIQNEIDKWNGKGELLTRVGRGFFAADHEFFGKKIEVISKKFAGRKEFFDYCCPDVYMADVYEFKFLAYEQCDISKMCDELVSSYDKIDLSRLIKKLFEYTSSNEKKMGSSLRSPPGYSRASPPQKNRSLPTVLLCALTSDFTGDCPPPPSHSLCQRVNLQLQFRKFLVILPCTFQPSLHLERGTHHAY